MLYWLSLGGGIVKNLIKSITLLTLFLFMACSPFKSKHNSKITDPDFDPKGREKGEVTDKAESNNWFTKDPEISGEEGVGADRFYREGQRNPNSREVLVAIIDSGVDIHHEDLKEKIWQNPGETGQDELGRDKATNGIDDDKNGYIDDVHGWNFIGGYDQEGKATHIDNETLEVTRLKKKYDDLIKKGVKLSDEEKKLHDKVTQEVEEALKSSNDTLTEFKNYLTQLKVQYEILKPLLSAKKFEEVDLNLLKDLKTQNEAQEQARKSALEILSQAHSNSFSRVQRVHDRAQDNIQYYFNVDYDPRSEIVKDNPEDFNDTHYGNNDVVGPEAFHGTHVAGIIGAQRDNQIGINGIAEKVKFIVLRVVPNGDERDKDVALAVRYAVNNGADIINMSFGKTYSPHKNEVDKAMLEAADKGVLLVHAAGNDSQNNNLVEFYPSRFVKESPSGGSLTISTWMEVGASSAFKGLSLPAVFSNYGSRTVDVFAPGFKIESTVPDNKYSIASGTSMASPTTAGVLALILSEKPELTGHDAKLLMVDQVRKYPGLEVNLPQEDSDTPVKKVLFDSLSIFGGITDVFHVLKN